VTTVDPDDVEPDGRRRRGLRRRAVLVEAALQVVARDGAAAVTHATVAAAAGLGRSAVSHHFASIDELLAAALRSGTEQLAAAVPRPDDGGGDLAWFAAALVDYFAADPGRVAAGYELYLLAARQPGLRPAVARWTDLLAELAGRHTTDPDAARAWVTAVDGYFLQHLAHGTRPAAAELERLLRAASGERPG
jgi:DNA-binding transcriptional regulator YbjK